MELSKLRLHSFSLSLDERRPCIWIAVTQKTPVKIFFFMTRHHAKMLFWFIHVVLTCFVSNFHSGVKLPRRGNREKSHCKLDMILEICWLLRGCCNVLYSWIDASKIQVSARKCAMSSNGESRKFKSDTRNYVKVHENSELFNHENFIRSRNIFSTVFAVCKFLWHFSRL